MARDRGPCGGGGNCETSGCFRLGPLPFLPSELPVQDPVRKGPHPASSFSAETEGRLSAPSPGPSSPKEAEE